jgi:hypothetical protein
VIGELPKLTGTSSEGVNAWRELGSWVLGLGELDWATLAVGLTALVVVVGLRFAASVVPGALVLVVGGLLDLGTHGVALVGDVPRGLPTPQIPDLDVVRAHLGVIGIAAVALLLIGFSQNAGDARAFAARHRYRIDLDQESVAQGMANVGAGGASGDAGVRRQRASPPQRGEATGPGDPRRRRAPRPPRCRSGARRRPGGGRSRARLVTTGSRRWRALSGSVPAGGAFGR